MLGSWEDDEPRNGGNKLSLKDESLYKQCTRWSFCHMLNQQKSSLGQLVTLHLERRAVVPGPWGRTYSRIQHLQRKPCLSLPFLPVHRQHFPFFRTAPEGWKNTIRHNLCFRDSFEKVPVSMRGGASPWPRSCLWKLTEEGHRRFEEEARALASSQLESIQQCMSQPGVRPCHMVGGGQEEGT